MRALALSVLVASALPFVSTFYLPGAAPTNYHEGDPVDVLVNALTPMLTESDDPKLVRGAIIVQRNSLISIVEISH